MTPNKLMCWSLKQIQCLEQRKIICKDQVRRTSCSCAKYTDYPMVLGEEIYRQNLGNYLQGVWPPSGWLVVIGVVQESKVYFQLVWCPQVYAQSKFTILHLGRGFSSYRITRSSASDCYVYSLRKYQEEPGPCSTAALLILSVSPISTSPKK